MVCFKYIKVKWAFSTRAYTLVENNLFSGWLLTLLTMGYVIQMGTPLQWKQCKLYYHYFLIVCKHIKKNSGKTHKNINLPAMNVGIYWKVFVDLISLCLPWPCSMSLAVRIVQSLLKAQCQIKKWQEWGQHNNSLKLFSTFPHTNIWISKPSIFLPDKYIQILHVNW